ncbi:lipoyl synthase [Blastopirellula marina]|uniref:Lipoyl synthase n=1 Tax=Blastopirellula marina DSM 3645 TaxID=314230 RepID=A3ZLR1_9BACT|nr:lipoyl synthase [Blastopirellula marina DSM 3645]
MSDSHELVELPIIDLPIIDAPAASSHPKQRLPKWLKRNVPKGNANHFTQELLEELKLETVCDSAKCPNRMECYSQKTATFMILGNICTRACSFCSVPRGKPEELSSDEPERLAEAAFRLGLKHVVITSVTRDDLPDGGAQHYIRCIEAVRERTGATVEVLTPDFIHSKESLDKIIVDASPDVFNHNTETVPRLYKRVRGPKSEYAWTLGLLKRVKALNPKVKTKSGLMLGLGETHEEVFAVLEDLRANDVDFLTLGQYLQPDEQRFLPVDRYIPPEEFEMLGRKSKELGFKQVASGPFVRSSYHARDMAEAY